MSEEPQEQENNRPSSWYKKGQSGNPGGRPKGSKSMKTYIKEKLESMTDEEREIYLDGLPKEIIWKMAEGNPHSTETSKVEVILPKPILGGMTNGVQNNNSTDENKVSS